MVFWIFELAFKKNFNPEKWVLGRADFVKIMGELGEIFFFINNISSSEFIWQISQFRDVNAF